LLFHAELVLPKYNMKNTRFIGLEVRTVVTKKAL